MNTDPATLAGRCNRARRLKTRAPRRSEGLCLQRLPLAFASPNALIAVGYMDPGNWATDLAGGSQFGYTLISVILVSSLMASIAANAKDESGTTSLQLPDKSRYTLIAPTPSEFMREMNTDRPDKTESPYTVDSGHFQLEMDLVSYNYDRDTSGGGDMRTGAFAVAPVNLKIGLLNKVDFQVVLETYNYVRVNDHAAGTVQKMSGFGDVTTRLKMNFWGNDGGTTAFGLLTFVKFPSNQDQLGNNAVEGGVIFPLAVQLPRGWDTGAMTEVDFLRDENSRGDHASFINSITFGHDLFERLGAYAEFFSEISTEQGARWIGTVDFGLTYKLTANVQLDTGINIGVTKAAPDFNPFVGLSWRF